MKKRQVAHKTGYKKGTVIDRAYVLGMIDAAISPETCILKEVIYTDKSVSCIIEINYDGMKFEPSAKAIDFLLRQRPIIPK